MSQVRQAADRLLEAERRHEPGRPVRDLIGSTDIAVAYAVQQAVIDTRIAAGARRIGRKIGLTSAAVQQQVGVDQPDFGVLLDDMAYRDGAEIPAGRLLQPRAEGEIAFVLASDIDDPELPREKLSATVAYACAAIEVVDSRVADWDIAITDTVADNASSGAFVLGQEQVPLTGFVPREVTMRMTVNGQERSSGTGAACLGDPLDALWWLARTSIEFGAPLRAGEVILSGALGPLVPVRAGDVVTSEVSGLGRVTVTFTRGGQS